MARQAVDPASSEPIPVPERPTLGLPKRHYLDHSIAVSLENLISIGNFSRLLEAILDLSFVRDRVGDRYADRGRSSTARVIVFKMHLGSFFDGIRSERTFVETALLHLAHCWYLSPLLPSDAHPASARNGTSRVEPLLAVSRVRP